MTEARFTPVLQGECSVSDDPDVIMSTVLGSCVAACIFDPENRVGGMNHYLFSYPDRHDPTDGRFAQTAMKMLIAGVLEKGGDRRNLQAKLFGGAHLTPHGRDIGAANAAFGQAFLEKEGIPCLSHSLGGKQARRVHFVPTTGAARQLVIRADAAPLLQDQA